MAVPLKEKRITTLVLVVLVGILIGSFLNSVVSMLPGENVVKTFFTYSIPFGIGDFAENRPVLIDLDAIRFYLGFQIQFSLLSILGVFLSLYFFRWYK
ncbi:DUF4321 domain-containing protein [Chitinispirillales bacterium ANBcel5]|uniref:DUF4321 domain-containing protein n=1 Tax=Cellulosispirillum alkaliphilum TaxID=3039283 RepID=UPI002A561B11|nr:DUF4321 domain-containing protein [Chitinispirillales bacterium ANBcel5]